MFRNVSVFWKQREPTYEYGAVCVHHILIVRHVYGDQARYFEMEGVPKLRHKRKGTVSMVNNGSDEHGSQFFVTLADDLDYLDGKHTVFGQVNEGVETLEKLNLAICDEKHRPYQDIRLWIGLIKISPHRGHSIYIAIILFIHNLELSF